MSRFSLRRQLLVLLLGAVGSVWLLLAVWTYVDAHHEIDEMFDAQLAQTAQLLLAQATHELDEIDLDEGRLMHAYQRRFVFQIWGRDGSLLLRSTSAPRTPLTGKEGFSETRLGKETWRVFARWDQEGEFLAQVAERHAPRAVLAGKIILRMLLPAALLLPLLALLVWIGVGRGLGSLSRLAREVGGRSPDQLDALDAAQAPQEVLPLVDALNALFERLRSALETERRFTADAAHELRTPLAALRVQAQVALRAAEEGERRHAVEQILAGVDRATHIVEQLLTLARLDHEQVLATHQLLDLRALAAEVIGQLAPAAVAKRIELSLLQGEAGWVQGDATMLAIALRNLIDNALRYSPSDGQVSVDVRREGSRVALEVCDSGPGIAPEESQRVLERFYRVAGSGERGSGLGLSIVQRVAELHHAELYLGQGAEGKGLRVRLLLAAAAQRFDTAMG